MSREEWEVGIARDIVRRGRTWMETIVASLGEPPDPAAVPTYVWTQVETEMTAILLAGLQAAFEDAALDAIVEAGVDVSWGMVNAQAIEFAQANAYTASRYCTQTTHQVVADLVERFYREGWDLGRLRSELLSAGFPPARASLIATTEVTKASSEAARFSARLSQVAGSTQQLYVEWQTSADEKVCAMCGPLNGLRVLDGQLFVHPSGQQFDLPPAHPGCRCGVGYTLMTSEEWQAYTSTG